MEKLLQSLSVKESVKLYSRLFLSVPADDMASIMLGDSSINEDLTSKDKDEIKKIVKDLVKKDRDIQSHLKKNTDDAFKGKKLEDKMIEVSKNALTQLFKMLYTRRGFWAGSITNKSS